MIVRFLRKATNVAFKESWTFPKQASKKSSVQSRKPKKKKEEKKKKRKHEALLALALIDTPRVQTNPTR